MRRTRNGVYERSYLQDDEFSAFIPNPLPPIPPLDLDQFQPALESAYLAVGYLDALLARLPSVEPLLYAYVRREALVSSQIEGTQSTFEDVLLYELGAPTSVPPDDTSEVSNYIAALNHGVTRMRGGFPLSSRLIREVHEILMRGEPRAHLAPGEFRRSQNWIGGRSPSTAQYVPPPPHALLDCMSQLEQFLHDERTILPTIARAGLAHAQFESIHPFLDGNGRAGRVLVSLIFEQAQLLSEPVLYLSLYVKRHRGEYYSLLGQLREHGDWELWLRYFIDGVIWTAEDCIATAEVLGEQLERDRGQLLGLGRQRASALQALEAFSRRPMLNLKDLAAISGLSLGAASAAVDSLMRAGIVEERTGQRRNRVFAYDAYLEVLSEGAEPL